MTHLVLSVLDALAGAYAFGVVGMADAAHLDVYKRQLLTIYK